MPEVNGQEVGPVGFGLMGLTWRAHPIPDEQAFAAMREALKNGCNLWNAGEIYGPPEANSLVLLERYFTKYPEDADKVRLCVKGAVDVSKHAVDASPEGIRRSLDNILKQLNGKKKLDMFECARRDPNVPLEITFGVLQKEYIDTGKLGGICLSEVSAQTINEAVKVAKIAAVELELSLWSMDILENGIAETCAQHNIPIVAYSPVGRGMLTGKLRSFDDLPEGDPRGRMPRFQPENFDLNLQLARQVEQIAEKKGCTAAQLALGWVVAVGKRKGMPLIIPIPGSTRVEGVEENSKPADLTEQEMSEIETTLKKIQIVGDRYWAGAPVNT